jgi:carbamoyl-phosphate synthase large subunit
MSKRIIDVDSVLILGSGGIKIAEAAEFDYSGSQALKALKDEGVKTILLNPNIATVQTSYRLADKVYLLPLDDNFVAQVIGVEKPDGILIGFGGQTALTAGVSLAKKGVLNEYGVKVLGTSIKGVETALDRQLFRKKMLEVGLPVPPSRPVTEVDEAVEAAEELGYPVIVRVSFNLGGRGSIIAWNRDELMRWLTRALAHSPVKGLIVEKYLLGWKEVEFEVVRDRAGNSVAIACLENVEPMGVHTGDSIVVAPSQTLTDKEYQELRMASIRVAEAIGLVGECNVQLALNQSTGEYYIIETNPRMSRSSALASKATGYPLAYIATKLALGYLLDELVNRVTGSTTAFFEPSLDYVIVKVPRWDFRKFSNVDDTLCSEMRSVGEVMAIGRNLEEAMQKAFRMLDIGELGLIGPVQGGESLKNLLGKLEKLGPYWPLVAAKAFRLGASIEEVAKRTLIDPFYLRVIKNVADYSRLLESIKCMPTEKAVKTLAEAAKLGFSVEQIATLSGMNTEDVAKLLLDSQVFPVVKNIDTLAGEYPAKTNYLYLTYNGFEDDISPDNGPKVIILGAGVFRIGVSVEFDWAVVSIAEALKAREYKPIVINYNPETVSTDWDMVDRLYFEELTPSVVEAVAAKEGVDSVIVFAGGQIGNNISSEVYRRGLKLVGTSPENINKAEDRNSFSRIVEELGLKQPPWTEASQLDEVKRFAHSVGYPIIIRPSYVLSGTSVTVAYNDDELEDAIKHSGSMVRGSLVVSKFFDDAIEAEIDGVSDGNEIYAVPLEHIEPAGVHSGDATIHTPVRKIDDKVFREMLESCLRICRKLDVKGPFNVQFLVRDGQAYVLELNLRCSRSMPMSSKAYGIDLMDLAANVILAGYLPDIEGVEEYVPGVYIPRAAAWMVKSPQFSWAQLKGAYPCLGPEMRSTGEVASQGYTLHEALIKSWLAAQPNRIPGKAQSILVYPVTQRDAEMLRRAAYNLSEIGYDVYTFTASPLDGFDTLTAEKAVEYSKKGGLGLVITGGANPRLDYDVRRAAADHNIPLILDARLGMEITEAIKMLADSEIVITCEEMRHYWTGGNRAALFKLSDV